MDTSSNSTKEISLQNVLRRQRKPKTARKYKRMFCSHCSSFVSKSTWYNHYDNFVSLTSSAVSGRIASDQSQPDDFSDCSDESFCGYNVRFFFICL